MADDATTTMPVDAQDSAAVTEPTETAQVDDEVTLTDEQVEIAGKQATTEVNAPDGETAAVVEAPEAGATDATTASGKKEKRKSTGGVPEHKQKKLKGKKSMVTLRLDCKPGEMYWARLKGYPPWPAIICDEQMLPESLLGSRPVSTARPDGTLRADFQDGGKNAKERTFPVMFLSTNEFSWMINTNLSPLKPEECLAPSKAKMVKSLQDAYKLASENRDLAYYKDLLSVWQDEEKKRAEEIAEIDAEEARLAEERAKSAEEAEKNGEEPAAAKEKKKKAPRKSKAADEDVEMEGAEAPKSSKKRKKAADSDGEDKPAKTPKVTKINAPKTPNGEGAASAKKSTSKSKKKVTAPKPEAEEEEAKPEMTEAERLAQREKAVLYLRHRLQKGFLSRDQAPQESEMSAMADFFTQLENYDSLEPAIIRTTKIHKVLKAIVKLSTIPKDEDFNFKTRSAAMLENWNKRLDADGEGAPAAADEPKSAAPEEKEPETNGTAKVEPAAETKEDGETTEGAKAEEMVVDKAESADKEESAVPENGDEAVVPAVEEAAESESKTTDPKIEASGEGVDGDGDVSMATAPEESIVTAA